jgi:MFS family permease
MKLDIPKLDLDINKVIKILVASDFVLYFALGLLTPIYAIFVTEQIEGGTLAVVGMATTMYWVARLLTTVPLSKLMDKTDGEKDEFYFMIIGTLLTALIFITYTFASKVWHVYALQFTFGVINSMIVPAWRIVFTNHIDRDKTGYYWSVEDIGIGLSVAASAYIGALVAEKFGFNVVLYSVAGLSVISAIVLTFLRKYTYTFKELRRLAKERKHLRPALKGHQSSDHSSK